MHDDHDARTEDESRVPSVDRPSSDVDPADALEQAEDLGPAEDDADVLDEEPADPDAGVLSPLDRVR